MVITLFVSPYAIDKIRFLFLSFLFMRSCYTFINLTKFLLWVICCHWLGGGVGYKILKLMGMYGLPLLRNLPLQTVRKDVKW